MLARQLQEHIRRFPAKPGVYTFKNTHGAPLYIGKAANLKSRLSAYPKTADVRIQRMIEIAESIEFQETDSDIEALILESQLIKRHKPQFNIVMRDDKQYFYVIVTSDEFPRLVVTHQPILGLGKRAQSIGRKRTLSPHLYALTRNIVGPFTDGSSLKATLRILRRLFPYCTCTQKHHVRCLNAHIGKCPGYCCLKVPATSAQKAAYRRNIGIIRDILQGKRSRLVKALDHDAIRRVFRNAQINVRMAHKEAPGRVEGYDIAHIQGQHATGAMIVFTDGAPDTSQYRLFTIKTVTGADDTAMLKEVLIRRFNHHGPDAPVEAQWPLPDLIVVDGGKAQLNVVVQSLKIKNSTLKIPVIALTKDDRHRGSHIYTTSSKTPTPLATLPVDTRDLILAVDAEAHRFAIAHYRKLHRKRLR